MLKEKIKIGLKYARTISAFEGKGSFFDYKNVHDFDIFVIYTYP